MTRSASEAFVRIAVRAAPGAVADRLVAEAYEAGAVGLEEREGEGGVTLLFYAPAASADPVRAAIAALSDGSAVALAEPVPQENWPDLWKQGLVAMVISPRLVVRPSCVAHDAAPGQAELVIDPGQAFGTGSHESTRLALDWIDARVGALGEGARVLDVGCGTGVLALAALALSPARAVACDIDPVAARETRANARANGLVGRIAIFTGGVGALGPVGFDLVVANLLAGEVLPILPELAARLHPDGRLILSGLLAAETGACDAALARAGLRAEGDRDRVDASGVCWRAWLTRR